MVKCKNCNVEQTNEQRGVGRFNMVKHFGRIIPTGAALDEVGCWQEFILCPACNTALTQVLTGIGPAGDFLAGRLLTTVDAAPTDS
jgi:hypothetical protein